MTGAATGPVTSRILGRVLARILALPQPVRFLFAGGFAAALNWLVRFPLSDVLPFTAAVFAATVIGMTAGFGLYQAVVFPGSRRPLPARLRDFVLVNLAGSAAVVAIAAAGDALLGHVLPGAAAQALAHAAGIAGGAALNYAGHRAVTFGDTRRPATADTPC